MYLPFQINKDLLQTFYIKSSQKEIKHYRAKVRMPLHQSCSSPSLEQVQWILHVPGHISIFSQRICMLVMYNMWTPIVC